MRTLVIDCATQALSLALFEGERLAARHHQLLGRGHAEALVPLVDGLLDGTRADALAVDVGPGSFTGIRVGIAAARALGFAWGVPVTGYGSLPMCAAVARRDGAPADAPVAIVMTGGHGELFWQHFAGPGLAPVAPVASTPVAELAASLADTRVHGSGAFALVAARGWGEAVDCLPDAAAWPLLPDAHRALPPVALYGREADAKPMAGAMPGVGARQ